MRRDDPILLCGGQTLVDGALRRALAREGFDRVAPDPDERIDWSDAEQTERVFAAARPRHVFVTAGRSGGIALNQAIPADLMRNNLAVALHTIETARRHGVERLLYLASSCCYPRAAPQPMRPDDLMTGPLEPTNAAYATAKLAGIELCRACRAQFGARFIAAIPATPYGPGDHFDPAESHVIGSLLRRMHEARAAGAGELTIWGTGRPRRDFIYADDLAAACLCVMERYEGEAPINLAPNESHSIAEIADLLREITGFTGRLVYDEGRPDGMPVKWCDATPLFELGWRPRQALRDGLEATNTWYLANVAGRRSEYTPP